MLDAIHRSYRPEYAFTPESMLSKIESARYPYGNIDLILVSHYHRDHFHAESIARHLLNNKGAELVSSPQVVEAVKKEVTRLEDYYKTKKTAETQFRTVDFDWKKSESVEAGGVKVEFLGLMHANSQRDDKYKKIQNFGHIIEISGKKLLHVGDADMFADNFSDFKLKEKDIDVAFVPYWYILTKTGREIMRDQIGATSYVAIHIPPTEQSKTVRSILSAMPGAVAFSTPGEMLNY